LDQLAGYREEKWKKVGKNTSTGLREAEREGGGGKERRVRPRIEPATSVALYKETAVSISEK